MSPIYQLKIKAYSLPNYHFIHTPNCYALITIDGDHTTRTQPVSGSDPEWSECFNISLKKSSTIAVQIFHVQAPFNDVLRGTALIHVGDPLPLEHETVLHKHKLHPAGVKYRKGGFVVVSLCHNAGAQSSDIASTNDVVREIMTSTPVVTLKQTSHLPRASQQLENECLVESGRAGSSAEDRHSVVVEEILMVTSTDLNTSILGYVNLVIQRGDVLPQVHPYAEVALKVLMAAHKILEGPLEHDKNMKMVLLTIRNMLAFVEDADSVSKTSMQQDTVSSMMVAIHGWALFAQVYGKGNLGTVTDDLILQYITAFNRLKANFDQGINILTFNAVNQFNPVLGDMAVAESEKALEGLPGWDLDGVRFNESKVCLDGTRKRLLEEIRTWAYSPDDRRILWVSGGAGTGKTSVANSIAAFFDKLGRLGACFCFNRDIAGLNTPSYLFGNLCYQLAHFHECGEFRLHGTVLSTVRSMGHIAAFSLKTQARKLIADISNTAQFVHPVVVVIDALDESGTMQAREELLDAITAEFPRLPQYLKIMITSRDEPDLRISLQGCSKVVCIDDADNTPEDIASYVEYRLTSIRRRSHLSQCWPGFCKSQELARRAGRLFLWASVACNFIAERRDPTWRLNLLLDVTSGVGGVMGSPLKELDILYNGILRNSFPHEDDPLTDFRYIVGSIASLELPLTPSGLDSLLGLGDEQESSLSVLKNGHKIHLSSSDIITSSLRSILVTDSTGPPGREGTLRLIHPSLFEFLVTRADKGFRIDPLEQNQLLAIRCLCVMNDQLRFDFCKIGDPSLLNHEVEDLPERLNFYISDGLRYSCHSIGYHLAKVSDPNETMKHAVRTFVSEHLLHWIEIMSLLGEINRAENFLHVLDTWIKTHKNDDVQRLVEDAIPFLRNSAHVIRLSALQTYYSALSAAPRTAELFRQFNHQVPYMPSIISSHPTWPPASVRILEDHTGFVNHVVFSFDGKKLASASYDKTVRLWDVSTGQAIGDALRGHTDEVNHVVFSPDGKTLASASNDRTVRLWDIETGKVIGEPLKGHTGSVQHVTFSPNGKRLASASLDGTVRVWDTESELPMGEVLNDHNSSVHHVAFSPDGKILASASYDKTVRLWDVETCRGVAGALTGHTNCIPHVVFSPDGKTLASASFDKTVRLWDVPSHQARGKSLEGHTGRVRHVAFSPDGKKLVSASDDMTLRLWDVESGQSIGATLEGHTGQVHHVTFSLDGNRLASASHDRTVRLWDIQKNLAIGEAIGEALKGHISWVQHATFSPDGKKLASASLDQTVRLWDIENGNAMGVALQGHTVAVNQVVISPDGQKLASASYDKTLQLWDVESGQPIGEALQGHTNWLNHVVFSPDGKKLASASGDMTVRVWDVESGKPIGNPLEGHTLQVFHVTFSPDGTRLASAAPDDTLRLWDLESGQSIGGQLLNGHTDWVLHTVFSPDGKKLASASYDATARLWDVESGQAFGEALKGHTSWVRHVTFSPNGKRLASASSDQTLRLWDVESGENIGTSLIGHTCEVHYVIFSADGNRLASASLDHTILIWDIESGQSIGDIFSPHSDNINQKLQVLDTMSRQWMRAGFITSADYGSGYGNEVVSNSVDQIVQASMSFDALGFLRHAQTRLLWLPVVLRGPIAVHSSLVVVGGGSGAVTILRLGGG